MLRENKSKTKYKYIINKHLLGISYIIISYHTLIIINQIPNLQSSWSIVEYVCVCICLCMHIYTHILHINDYNIVKIC